MFINERRPTAKKITRPSQPPLAKPKLVREIKAEKEQAKQQNKSIITIANISKQMIPIHLNPPAGVDFYIGAEDKHLRPGQRYPFPKHRVRIQQIIRLQKRGFISVISDSDRIKEESNQKVVVMRKK